jgi:hypothetical protein
MKQNHCFSDDHPKLYYRATCGRCRVISAILTALSLGVVQRLPLSSREALELIAAESLKDGRPALFFRGRFTSGFWLLPCLGIATLNFMVCAFLASTRSAIRDLSPQHFPSD